MVPPHGVSHNLEEVYRLKMISNKYFVLGLQSSLMCLLVMGFISIIMILYSFLKCTTIDRIIFSLYGDGIIIISDDVNRIAMLK